MKSLRPEEEWARQLMERALGVAVKQHDDGSQPGMYDLSVLRSDAVAAAEVTTAADAETIEFWNLMNRPGERWQITGLKGGWLVSVEPSARVKRLKTELPMLLGQLERAGRKTLRVGRGAGDALDQAAATLRVVRASQGGTSFPGSIYVTLHLPIERSAGFAVDTGDALASWIGDFLRAPEQSDVRRKLGDSGCSERHAFVIFLGFTPARFSVIEPLVRDDAPLPTVDPPLPIEVTDVWAVSSWSTGSGFCWSGSSGWRRFAKD